jgi:flagellin-specific chaperone FliS
MDAADVAKKYKQQEWNTTTEDEIFIKLFDGVYSQLKMAQKALNDEEFVEFSHAISRADAILWDIIKIFSRMFNDLDGKDREVAVDFWNLYHAVEEHIFSLLESRDVDVLEMMITFMDKERKMWTDFWNNTQAKV